MIKYLEDNLYAKTKDSQSKILFTQWDYDKKVISTALQAVSALFPHYSLHDESHSVTIINNIVRVIGKENIAKLSAIDIWLLLEASYSHDIGMVVSGQELNKSLESEEFKDFFKDLIQDEKNRLHEFACQFQIDGNTIKYKNDTLDLKVHNGIKFILAEFFRRSHADRSKDIITNPSRELGLPSPRGVIPQRIVKILADICSCHTKSFDDVMALPFCEVGIDTEDAHPRFIACLLRIGDLLDLDNNRFSEVMLRTLTTLPKDTLDYKAKHFSIESFRVDREKIEVKAKCENYETANITQHWFNYLNSEISNQMIRWNEIVPSKDFGYLPTIGDLKVELLNYEYIDGKNQPKFKVNTDKAFELLRGTNLYLGKHQSIREILQNATDATLLRMWLEHEDDLKSKTPQSKKFIELAQQYPITVQITEKEQEGEWKNWLIEIIDKGTGISEDDLKFLMNTGSSSKNRKKANIIESMPAWMRPSGTFGIGFQSIFMLTDVVTIETKSYFDEQFQIITLNSPTSLQDGNILIEKKKTTHAVKPGTKIIINYKTKAIPDRISINLEPSNASRIAENFDPFTHDSLDIELGKVCDEVFNFSNKNCLPIELIVEKKGYETSTSESRKFNFFEPENSLEFQIRWEENMHNVQIVTYYKNQEAENKIRLKFLSLNVNIHKHKASQVLTLDRNKVKPEYEKTLKKDILQSLFKILPEDFNSIFKTDESKAIGSMFLNYYFEEEASKELDIRQYNQWENFEITVDDTRFTLKRLLESIDSLKLVYNNEPILPDEDLFYLKDKELSIRMRGGRTNLASTEFFLFMTKNLFSSISMVISDSNHERKVSLTKEEQGDVMDRETLVSTIKGLRHNYSSRMIIPCNKKYFTLRIKDNAHQPYVYHYWLDINVHTPFPKMLSPFVTEQNLADEKNFKLALNDKVYNWVYTNRYNEKTTLEDIKAAYAIFIKDFDVEELNKGISDTEGV